MSPGQLPGTGGGVILAVNVALIVGIVWMAWPSETTVGA
jgi:hypothetical protein